MLSLFHLIIDLLCFILLFEMKENDEIAFWAKQKFNRNIERHSKHHPMISSLRQKAAQKYIDIMGTVKDRIGILYKNVFHIFMKQTFACS